MYCMSDYILALFFGAAESEKSSFRRGAFPNPCAFRSSSSGFLSLSVEVVDDLVYFAIVRSSSHLVSANFAKLAVHTANLSCQLCQARREDTCSAHCQLKLPTLPSSRGGKTLLWQEPCEADGFNMQEQQAME